MKKLRAYYAHPLSTYGSERERAIVSALSREFDVVDPSKIKFTGDSNTRMAQYLRVVRTCQALFYDATDRIGPGVAREVLEALVFGIPVYRLSRFLSEEPLGYRVYNIQEEVISIEEMRSTLAKV